jgi:hypothetical protein
MPNEARRCAGECRLAGANFMGMIDYCAGAISSRLAHDAGIGCIRGRALWCLLL